jgi:hypothetical protein
MGLEREGRDIHDGDRPVNGDAQVLKSAQGLLDGTDVVPTRVESTSSVVLSRLSDGSRPVPNVRSAVAICAVNPRIAGPDSATPTVDVSSSIAVAPS